MQLHLPYFPKDTKMISDCVGVYEYDGLVQYIVNGLPVYAHAKDDLNSFRFITGNFIHQGLCRKVDIERGFGVSEDSVYRYYQKFITKGGTGFFGEDSRQGKAHKIVGERKVRIQQKLDKGQSVLSISKEEYVRESAIRYHIKQGTLKKVPQLTDNGLPATLNDRNQDDQRAPLGIATTNYLFITMELVAITIKVMQISPCILILEDILWQMH